MNEHLYKMLPVGHRLILYIVWLPICYLFSKPVALHQIVVVLVYSTVHSVQPGLFIYRGSIKMGKGGGEKNNVGGG